nr:hypothetical protein [Tanacetum cinerariifolium]
KLEPAQSKPDNGPDWQTGRGAVFAHRPAQCHGRPRGGRPKQPAARPPQPGQPRAPRRGAAVLGQRAAGGHAGLHGHRNVHLDSVHQPAHQPAQRAPGRGRPRQGQVRGGAGNQQPARNAGLRRCDFARRRLGRKRGHHDQFGAPHQPPGQGSGRARRGAARCRNHLPLCAGDGFFGV